ncbi:MAG: hypothetical protein Q9180_001663 [Flavoplaca navasiana]
MPFHDPTSFQLTTVLQGRMGKTFVGIIPIILSHIEKLGLQSTRLTCNAQLLIGNRYISPRKQDMDAFIGITRYANLKKTAPTGPRKNDVRDLAYSLAASRLEYWTEGQSEERYDEDFVEEDNGEYFKNYREDYKGLDEVGQGGEATIETPLEQAYIPG